MRNAFLAVVAVVSLASPAAAPRLADTVVPEHYTLWVAPDLAKETFRGRETIQAVVTQPTTSVTLHAAEIQFGEVKITSGGRTQTARVTTDPKAETATFTVPQRLAEGPVTIEVMDVQGRLIRRWPWAERNPGDHPFTWDGRTASGEEAPTGLYLVRARHAGRTAVARLVRLR